ncbi:acetoacetate--CoA ligase [Coxiella burnetii]|uniref:Acetoacetyl-CoA synthetase n=1 Tax=Coxiella burnetii (strain RSA 493 / Nine Mile phase I) TaxID=227377 RepID=Q83DG9_COXBU|nr:acetoacetate--CoA ligase [Coxiella burnetii]NP_819788.1 acetoacetyl-CoA synthetase [Coxiella burnetii RSA 493]AAO90302.1 acetoacetyl-CoA synthetase [Coxiella burnetii RSA 493]OYK84345.1 acetoacetate--CoA ligase [Coxiella burnetii]OYK88162.1 acetoacetate--CoA ligase [Coxiella burnetii]OYK91616.1 acetoacetate--CoA ligase [Coxiella burnetii]OYK95944.1 acetoacetate--CoA ligase [Coxiella burnetii]
MEASKPLWEPSSETRLQSQMSHFISDINKRFSLKIEGYPALYQWSIDQPALFWKAVWDFCGISASQAPTNVLVRGKRMEESQWFLGAKLNFAENLLRHRNQNVALIFTSETGFSRSITYAELYTEVAALAGFLRQCHVVPGDRVVGVLSNQIETVIAMLATASVGAIWSACSPDFGLEGLVDRFGQIKPKVLFAVDSHTYKGKTYHHLDKIRQLQQQLTSLTHTIIVPNHQKNIAINELKNASLYPDCLRATSLPFYFEALPFDHPVYILYSSGTTGKPKCMVHSAGGTLLQHLKELILHTDLRPSQRIFFYTTCSWMMWNWLMSSLAVGATVVLYDGAPFYPTPTALFDLIDKVGISIFGVGAKILESAEKFDLVPKKTHNLLSLKTILTTGSPLLPKSFDYVYNNVKSDIQLSSISGGSDIISCFALGNSLLPVYRGELQCIGLGMDVKIFNDDGDSVIEEKGELVCKSPFPSMPIYFWNDPEGKKYHQAYFDKYPNTWAHGDYAKTTKRGTLIIYGRSDTTLNPGGIRIGTAEIYQQVEKIKEILDCLVTSQQWKGDERIILFVVLQKETTLTDPLRKKIQTTIRQNLSPHHVPNKIIAVPDLPRTKSGKIVELAVKKIINGESVNNLTALENPKILEYFQNLKELG